MSPNAESIALADPVCGKPVGVSSPHRHVHGGALFCFCGETCRARFAAHPSRLAFIALSGGVRTAPATPEHDAAEGHPRSRRRTLGGGSFNVLRAWRERRMATRCCRTLLGLHESLSTDHPQLSGPGLYEKIVATHIHCDSQAAQAVLKGAEQSYAVWPIDRDLCFRDVVHYLAVCEIFVADSASPWAQANIKRIVDASIPRQL